MDDLELADLNDNLNKSKKIKTGAKGKRGELDIVHALNNRFGLFLSKNPAWGLFSRSIGSGNRGIGQNVYLPQHAKDTFSGDLCCPTSFRFVIESKNGYKDIDLFTSWGEKGCKELNAFLEQVTNDSNKSSRLPLLLWKKDRKGTVAFLKHADFEMYSKKTLPAVVLFYNEWIGFSFDYLLLLDDDFFFS